MKQINKANPLALCPTVSLRFQLVSTLLTWKKGYAMLFADRSVVVASSWNPLYHAWCPVTWESDFARAAAGSISTFQTTPPQQCANPLSIWCQARVAPHHLKTFAICGWWKPMYFIDSLFSLFKRIHLHLQTWDPTGNGPAFTAYRGAGSFVPQKREGGRHMTSEVMSSDGDWSCKKVH